MTASVATTTKWAIDPAHTEVQFKVKHLVISTVTGTFKEFSGEVFTENENFDGAEVNFTIAVASIDTNNADRNAHLKSDDFFSAETYPNITFSGVLNNDGGEYQLTGNMTIRDVTRQVTLNVDYNGTVKDPWGNTKAGFELTGKINRKDFGLTWNTITEAGGMLVGEEVKLVISAQLAVA